MREGVSAGGQAAMKTFEATRPLVGAQAIGIARAAYEYSLDYAKERVQFGRPIIENQAIAFKLADMITEIGASRLLVWRASWMAHSGKRFEHGEGSMSKLKAAETAVHVTDEAIQILGGYGYVREPGGAVAPRCEDLHDLRRHERDQRLVIARAISGVHIR
jgi:alkylation response protein AidB-like acyl-CoA dehydrogenase